MAVVRTIRLDPTKADPAAVAEAVRVLRDGGIVAYPTETLYALGVDARNREACRRLVLLKGREEGKSFPCIVSGIRQLELWSPELDGRSRFLAERFWPGPLTLVVAAGSSLAAAAPDGTVAVRASGLPLARDLADALGGPITATSANRSGAAPARTAEEVVLGDLGSGIDLLLDAGACPGGSPSTVVDARSGRPKLLREGRVPFAEVSQALREAPSS